MNEYVGLKITNISSAAFKTEGDPDFDLSDDAVKSIQSDVDKLHEKFVSALTRNRDLPASRIRSDFGQGRVLLADDAKSAGMVDRIGTLDEVVSKLAGAAPSGSRKAEADSIPFTVEQARLQRKMKARRCATT